MADELSRQRVAVQTITEVANSDPPMVSLTLRDATNDQQSPSPTPGRRFNRQAVDPANPMPGVAGGSYTRTVPRPESPFYPGEILTIVLMRGDEQEEASA